MLLVVAKTSRLNEAGRKQQILQYVEMCKFFRTADSMSAISLIASFAMFAMRKMG
jgi:hypothetical protein